MLINQGTQGVLVMEYPVSHLIPCDNARKKSEGVAIRRPVLRETAVEKCFVLWVNSQSGLLLMADSNTGTSAACRIREREAITSASSG